MPKMNPSSTLTTEAVNLLKQMIAHPSTSRAEEAVADLLQAYIEQQGLTAHRQGNNIWCLSTHFSAERKTLLLNSHIDTVKPAAAWQRDPFSPTVEDGRLYGLGSNDAGASVVSLLHVFLTLCRKQLSYNLVFLASCEEEVSGKNGIESVLPLLPPITLAIVGEPTEVRPAVAEKGLMVIGVTAEGR